MDSAAIQSAIDDSVAKIKSWHESNGLRLPDTVTVAIETSQDPSGVTVRTQVSFPYRPFKAKPVPPEERDTPKALQEFSDEAKRIDEANRISVR